MSRKRPVLRLFLDEGVPDSVGRVLAAAGHEVIYLRHAIATGSPDQLVCAAAQASQAILVALDGDMRKIARDQGVGSSRFKTLSLIKLSCRETRAAERIERAISLIEHEWGVSKESKRRRIFIEIRNETIVTRR